MIPYSKKEGKKWYEFGDLVIRHRIEVGIFAILILNYHILYTHLHFIEQQLCTEWIFGMKARKGWFEMRLFSHACDQNVKVLNATSEHF